MVGHDKVPMGKACGYRGRGTRQSSLLFAPNQHRHIYVRESRFVKGATTDSTTRLFELVMVYTVMNSSAREIKVLLWQL